MLPQVRGRRDTEVRRGAAHHRGAHRRRGGAGHGQRRAPAAARALRGLRPHPRGPRARGRRAAQGQPVRRAGGPGRRVARPADRPHRQPRPPGARAAPQGRERLGVRRRGRVARGVPRARVPHRARPVLGTRGHLPGTGGGARPRRRGAPARHPREGARGARCRPGRHPRRRRHQRDAHPPRRARRRPRLGGAPHPPRGPGHGQPPRQLRRRQPAPLGAGRGRRRGAGRAGAGDPRRRHPRPPARGRSAAPRAQAGLARGAGPARRPRR